MKSDYENVSADLDVLWDLLWDSMPKSDPKKFSKATQAKRCAVVYAAYDQLLDELMAGHGWTMQEWRNENDRRVESRKEIINN